MQLVLTDAGQFNFVSSNCQMAQLAGGNQFLLVQPPLLLLHVLPWRVQGFLCSALLF
jgi:hypothetical protein